ncbi:sulfurtransferase [Chryseosolibacter indicus]|uniref:Sulfurtransferase n=1 Tax=Chryseosolibacter indicus TaxID=2782351 RepID=A0ABS5VN83_9BACT|nr:sulfurtransferase [Chryseosolibacter indicus]MBT1702232.1 sulfurtransferase [Chryseosolibacter indicus]
MAKINPPLIDASEVKQHLAISNTVVIDARSGPDAFERYSKGHVARAIHVDLDKDLSKKPEDAAKGGRHPLPAIEEFSSLLGKLGITPSSHIIAYDDKNGANAAARFWWMMKAVGHEKVQVVNGGLDALVKEGIASATDASVVTPTSSYPVDKWKRPTQRIEDVEKAASDSRFLVVDVREAFRYRGEREPIDLVAGHIPGAVNIPYINNLDTEGKFLPAEELEQRYKQVIGERPSENVIVHCGSGVTACHTLLAMEHAGITGAQLYVGSWSEWSRTGRTIATGD